MSLVGISKSQSSCDYAMLEYCIREDLKPKAPRYMGVLRPVKLIIDNYPEGQTEEFEIENNTDNPDAGTRKITFSRELYIEADDFMEEPPKKYFRLFPGNEVRLKGAYFVKCTGFEKDADGQLTRRVSAEQLAVKYFLSEHKQEAKVSESAGEGQQQVSEEHKDASKAVDYSQYVIPDGMKVEQAAVFKKTQGKNAGLYAISAIVNGQRSTRILSKDDLNAYYSKSADGKRKAELDQLVAKYFGKAADNLSIGSVSEAKEVLAEGQQAQLDAAQEDIEKAQAELKKKEEQRKAEEAKEKEEKKVIPVEDVQAALLVGALLSAKAADGIWLNKDGKKAPDFVLPGRVISPFNAVMMNLHSDANGYKTNRYISFNQAHDAGFSVKKGETGLAYNWYSWDKYVNKFDMNNIITEEQYKALPEEEKDLFRAYRSSDVKKVFNIDQTTMGSVKETKAEYKQILANENALGRGIKDTVEVPAEGKSFYETFKESNTAILLLHTGNSTYELYGDDALHAAKLLGVEAGQSNDLKDASGNPLAVVSIPEKDLEKVMNLLVKDGKSIAISDKPESEAVIRRYGTADKIYKTMQDYIDGIQKLPDAKEHFSISSMRETRYDADKDVLHLNDSRQASPGEEIDTALSRAADNYRALVAYTGVPERLNRGAKMLPEDAMKYDRLVQEITAGYILAHQGLPAKLSDDSLELVPYWERELKEDPKLMERLETDVTNAMKAVNAMRNGEEVDYSAMRGEKSVEAMRPKFYTIATEIANIPSAESRKVVIVRDDAAKSAAIVLPAGASLEKNNELPGMNKSRFALALKKQGIEDIQFYNAGGALGLQQPNEFFADKEIQVAHLKNYELIVDEKLNVKEEIARTSKVEIQDVRLIRDDNDKHILYVRAAGEKPFTIYPERKDIELMKGSIKKIDPAVKDVIGQKYYAFAQKHPELKVDIFTPKIGEVDLSRIQKVSIGKDKYKEGKFVILATIDNELVHSSVSKVQFDRMWLAGDLDLYKKQLAAVIFGEKLGLTEGAAVAQFPDNHEGPDRNPDEAAGQQQSAGEQEEREVRHGRGR